MWLIDLSLTILLFFTQNEVSLSPAQYWKVSKTSNLVNKSGKWQFSSLKWSLPEENCEGLITDNASGKILDVVDQESLVELVDIEDASLLSNGQTWIKAKQNKDGWFMLINPSSNKVLTALTSTTTSISGFYNKSYIFLYMFLTFCLFLIYRLLWRICRRCFW